MNNILKNTAKKHFTSILNSNLLIHMELIKNIYIKKWN